MAGVDKIYGTNEQYLELKEFLIKRHRYALKYLYPFGCYDNHMHRPISNFPRKIDEWLLKYCKMNWVLVRIREQYY